MCAQLKTKRMTSKKILWPFEKKKTIYQLLEGDARARGESAMHGEEKNKYHLPFAGGNYLDSREVLDGRRAKTLKKKGSRGGKKKGP